MYFAVLMPSVQFDPATAQMLFQFGIGAWIVVTLGMSLLLATGNGAKRFVGRCLLVVTAMVLALWSKAVYAIYWICDWCWLW